MPSRSEFGEIVGCLVRTAHGDVTAVPEDGWLGAGQDGGHMFICRPSALHQGYCLLVVPASFAEREEGAGIEPLRAPLVFVGGQ